VSIEQVETPIVTDLVIESCCTMVQPYLRCWSLFGCPQSRR
jgi:hypothetical protein